MSTLVLDTIQDRVSSDSQSVTQVFSGWTKIATQTASASASIDFTSTHITSTYDKYCFAVETLRPATDNVSLILRVSQGAGFLTATNYVYHSQVTNASASSYSGVNGTAASGMIAGYLVGNDTHSFINAMVYLTNPANASSYPSMVWNSGFFGAGTVARGGAGQGYYGAAGACDGVQFLMDSGNIADGSITLYGLK